MAAWVEHLGRWGYVISFRGPSSQVPYPITSNILVSSLGRLWNGRWPPLLVPPRLQRKGIHNFTLICPALHRLPLILNFCCDPLWYDVICVLWFTSTFLDFELVWFVSTGLHRLPLILNFCCDPLWFVVICCDLCPLLYIDFSWVWTFAS